MVSPISFMIKEFKFYTSLGYNVVLHKCHIRNMYNRITDKLVLGAIPFKSKWPKIQSEENIKGILAMVELFELKKFVVNNENYKDYNLEYLQLPVQDFYYAPTQDQVEQGIKFIENCQGDVYVHCKAGRTRSAIVVVCYVIKTMNMDSKSAIEFVQSKRPVVKLLDIHKQCVEEYYQNLSK